MDDTATAQGESHSFEFKEYFDPASPGHWCEIVKDIVAMANSGGGVIVFGVNDQGVPTGRDVSPILALDPADITNKVYKYTGTSFSSFALQAAERDGHHVAVLKIGEVPFPLIFQAPGTYAVDEKKQKTAFAVGTIYFRHGAKSEPGTIEDLRNSFNRLLGVVREEWLGNIRTVMEAPPGATIIAVPEGSSPTELAFRLTSDPNAPELRVGTDRDTTHPYRMTELVTRVTKLLPDGVLFNQHDVLCVTRVHKIADQVQFQHQPKFGSAQYSEAFAQWIVDRFNEDPTFFEVTRRAYKVQVGPKKWKRGGQPTSAGMR